MPKLDAEDLQVDSFATTASELATAVAVTVETQEAACWSPLCMDTAGKTCPQLA